MYPSSGIKGKPKNISEENLGDATEVNTDESKSKDKNVEGEEILENSFQWII